MITTSIKRNEKKISDIGWNTFLKGAGLFEEKKMVENTATKIIKTDPQYKLLNYVD